MVNNCTNENYEGSHRKGRLEYLGQRFLIVKQRKAGKPMPNHFALLTMDLEPVSLGSNFKTKEWPHGPQTEDDWLALFKECFPDTDGGRKALKEAMERVVG